MASGSTVCVHSQPGNFRYSLWSIGLMSCMKHHISSPVTTGIKNWGILVEVLMMPLWCSSLLFCWHVWYKSSADFPLVQVFGQSSINFILGCCRFFRKHSTHHAWINSCNFMHLFWWVLWWLHSLDDLTLDQPVFKMIIPCKNLHTWHTVIAINFDASIQVFPLMFCQAENKT